MENEDTETLLALVASLVNGEHNHSVMLDALLQSEGNVERAVQRLNDAPSKSPTGGSSQSHGKTKDTKLDNWFRSVSSSAPVHLPSETVLEMRSSFPLTKRLRPSSPDTLQRAAKHPRFDSDSRQQASPSKGKTITNQEFMAILRPLSSTNPERPKPPNYPPLTLATPDQVARHTPCTLHASVLPPELACRLFYTMIDLSENWQRNKWWLFDRVVESPHRTSFFVRDSVSEISGTESADMHEAAQFWYNGRQTEYPDPFPVAMEEACSYIEKVVNDEMRKRARFPLEWGGEPSAASNNDGTKEEKSGRTIWRANVAASNRYEGSQESVGFHSDQLTYLGPYPTIASLSLGTTRTFRLREVIPTEEKTSRSARTYNIPLAHNTLIIMHASCQEMFKHSIPPQHVIDPFHPLLPRPNTKPDEEQDIPASNSRINITFRYYRPDFRSSTTPRCKCGVPCILRPDMKNRYSLPSKRQASGGPSEPGCARDSSQSHESEDAEKRYLVAKYWWTCYAGAQNEGKGCGFWKVMDAVAEGRGPFAGDVAS